MRFPRYAWGFYGLNTPSLSASHIDVYIYTGWRILAALRHLQFEIISEVSLIFSLLIAPGRSFR